jgi:hypothetical protein
MEAVVFEDSPHAEYHLEHLEGKTYSQTPHHTDRLINCSQGKVSERSKDLPGFSIKMHRHHPPVRVLRPGAVL